MRSDKFVEKLKAIASSNGDAKVVRTTFEKDLNIHYVTKVAGGIENGTGLCLWFEYGSDPSKGLTANELISELKEFNHDQYFPYTPVLIKPYGSKIRTIQTATMYKSTDTFVVIS